MANLFFPLNLIHRFSTVSPIGSPTTVNLEILSFDQLKPDVDLVLSDQARLIFAPAPISKILCSTAVLHATSVGPNPMADIDSWFMNSKLMDATLTGDPVFCLVKGTVNDHFYDGEEAAAAARRVLQSTGFKGMLVYGVEHTEDGGPPSDNIIEKFIETIEGAKTLPTSHLRSVVIKITAICPMSLLKRVSDLLRWQYKNPNFKLPWKLSSFPVFSGLSHIYHTISEPEPLTVEEEQELEKAHQRLKSISQRCQESNVLLLIEAEDTILQPAIDYMAYWSAIMFNHTTSEPEALTVEEEQELKKAHKRMKSSCPPPPSPSLNQTQPQLSPPPSLSLNQIQPPLSPTPSPSLDQTQPPLSPPPSLSLNQPQPRPSSSSPSRLPQGQQSSPFLNVAPPHPLNISNHVPDPHHMDTLSWTALGYCFAAGLEFNAIFAQVANPNNISFRVQLLSLLLNIALYLLIAANGIFARTHPNMAFVMDRVGSAMVIISSTIAAMPTIPEYVSIGLAVFMIVVYAHQRFSS